MRYLYNAGERVGHGCYLSLGGGEQIAVGRAPRTLPGAAGSRWLRFPWPVVVLLAPVVSFLFVVFLPFIGIGMTLYVAAAAVVKNVNRLAHRRSNVILLTERRERVAEAARPPAAPPDAARDQNLAPVDELAARRTGDQR